LLTPAGLNEWLRINHQVAILLTDRLGKLTGGEPNGLGANIR